MGRLSTKENKSIYQQKREELGLSRDVYLLDYDVARLHGIMSRYGGLASALGT